MSDLKHYQLIAQPSMEPKTVIDIWSTPENIDALERTLRRLVFPYAFQLYVAPGPHTQHPGVGQETAYTCGLDLATGESQTYYHGVIGPEGTTIHRTPARDPTRKTPHPGQNPG